MTNDTRYLLTSIISFAVALIMLLLLISVMSGCATLPELAEGKRFQLLNKTKHVVQYQIYCIDHPYAHDGKVMAQKGRLGPGEYLDTTLDWGFGRYSIGLQFNKEQFLIPIRASKTVEKIFLTDPKMHKELKVKDKLDQFRIEEKKEKKKRLLKGFKTKS